MRIHSVCFMEKRRKCPKLSLLLLLTVTLPSVAKFLAGFRVSELVFNVPPTRRSYENLTGLESHPQDQISGGSILRALNW